MKLLSNPIALKMILVLFAAAIAFVMAGHVAHHLAILRERYGVAVGL